MVLDIALKSPPKTRRTGDSQRSLFGEILDWMLAPLLFVWPISIALTHYFANNVAAFPYDQALREHARRQGMRTLREDGGRWVARGETSVEEVLAATHD